MFTLSWSNLLYCQVLIQTVQVYSVFAIWMRQLNIIYLFTHSLSLLRLYSQWLTLSKSMHVYNMFCTCTMQVLFMRYVIFVHVYSVKMNDTGDRPSVCSISIFKAYFLFVMSQSLMYSNKYTLSNSLHII